MSTKNPRIFISSTIGDLPMYRKAVLDAVIRVGALPVMLESDAPAETGVEEVIKREIDRSDAVLLLVGFRYGTPQPKSGKSWVEAEYDAVKRSRKPVLVFLAGEDVPWPPKFIDRDQSLIQKFRQRLATDLVVRFFSGPDDLGFAIMEALTQFVAAQERPPQVEKTKSASTLQIRIVRLLLSSPGDVAAERDRVANAVFRFNQQSVEESGLFIKLVRWEDMAPQIGPKPQAVINMQIGAYDLFCGIMWNRFGTPTEIAASGTKEEFDGAVQCWEKDNHRPWITFYFCDRPANFTTLEQLEQKRLVLEFRAQLHSKGIVRTFLTAQEFEELVLEDLRRITKNLGFNKMLNAG